MSKYVGFRGWVKVDGVLRFHGIDAPKLEGETKAAGEASKAFLSNLILGKEIIFTTFKDKRDRYARFISVVYVAGLEDPVNDWMVKNGHAVYQTYA